MRFFLSPNSREEKEKQSKKYRITATTNRLIDCFNMIKNGKFSITVGRNKKKTTTKAISFRRTRFHLLVMFMKNIIVSSISLLVR